MEVTIGECANLHITHPAMVFGYMFVIRANRHLAGLSEDLPAETPLPPVNSRATTTPSWRAANRWSRSSAFKRRCVSAPGGAPFRDDISRYQAVVLAMIEPLGQRAGDLFPGFSAADIPLRIEQFFQTLSLRYKERFLFGAPDLKKVTWRIEWSAEAPALAPAGLITPTMPTLDYAVRVNVSN